MEEISFWVELREWLTAIGTLALGAGALWFARIGQASRSDKQFQYKFDLSKEALVIFNKMRNDFHQIRSPITFEGDASKLQELPEENELIKKMKKNTRGGMALMRLDERSETLADLNKLEPEFCAIFGKTNAFDDMRSVRHSVYVSAMALTNGDYGDKHEEVIWCINKDTDPLVKKMDNAVKEIESICVPVLGGKKQ